MTIKEKKLLEYDMELFKTRIEAIKDPIQKIVLEDVLKDVFISILEYSNAKLSELEKRIDAQIEDSHDKYYIYTGICKKSEIDETSRFLFEMNVEDEEEYNRTLDTIFIKSDFYTINECLGKIFHGVVVTENNIYNIKVSLEYSKKYLSKIKWLYQQFQRNRKEWRTINCPYLYKLLDIIDIDKVIPLDEVIQSCQIDIPGLNHCIDTDMTLVWNICEQTIKIQGEEKPGDKTVLFDHKIDLWQEEGGYIAAADEWEDFYTIQDKECLHIITEDKSYEKVKILQIVSYNINKDSTKLLMPLQTNKRNMRHIDRQAIKQPKVILTIGEVERILSSYEAYSHMKLESVSLSDDLNKKTIDFNQFIQSHIFLEKKPVLLFSFSILSKNYYLIYETMFFLVSELQLYFGEYKCLGEIV